MVRFADTPLGLARRFRAGLLLALTAGVLLALPGGEAPARETRRTAAPKAAAQPANDDPTLWRLASGYEVTREGDPVFSAQVYQSRDFKHLLVFPDEGLDVWVLDLAALDYYLLTATDIGVREARARVPSLKGRTASGKLVKDEAELRIPLAEGAITLAPGEALVGEVSPRLLLRRRPDYGVAAGHYTPDPNAIAILKTRKSPAEIFVFFGTWCPTCKRVVPSFMKTMELAANPNIRVRYIARDADRREPAGLLDRFEVRTTPTIVVLAGDRELGRIAGGPKMAIERELVNILTKGN
jgi:thiol-disulfide isomerase/thioredoxin